jgi:hypothetical protein
MDTDADADAEGSCVDKTRRACEADIDDIRAVSPSVKDLSVHGEGLYV